MSERNLGIVNNVLGIEANGNPGDVITRDTGLGVGWAPAAGIAGIAASNAGVPVAGGPWQTLDAITGTLVDGGGGVLQYTPPAVPAAAWTTVSKPNNQAEPGGALVLDTDLFTGLLTAGVKYRIRAHIFWNNQDGNGGQGQFAVPGLTFYRERQWAQGFNVGGNVASGGVVGTAPMLYSNPNQGDGVLEIEIVLTPSANGIVQWQFSGVAGQPGNLTVYAGSYLEYGIA